jgi:hypothetical protein
MIVKGRPDTGLTITSRCDMGPGLEDCQGTDHMLSFDLQYLICFIRFGYGETKNNGYYSCGYIEEDA